MQVPVPHSSLCVFCWSVIFFHKHPSILFCFVMVCLLFVFIVCPKPPLIPYRVLFPLPLEQKGIFFLQSSPENRSVYHFHPFSFSFFSRHSFSAAAVELFFLIVTLLIFYLLPSFFFKSYSIGDGFIQKSLIICYFQIVITVLSRLKVFGNRNAIYYEIFSSFGERNFLLWHSDRV